MSREILFKAKRANWRELPKKEWWVEGSLITGVFLRGGQDIPYILCPEKADYDCFEDFSEENGIFEVVPETICEYTGLTDKNGRKIFEGDILQIETENLTKDDGYFTIEWSEPGCCFVLCGNKYLAHFDNVYKDFREVIGNIFDNPELLKDGQQPESPITHKEDAG